MKKWIIVESVLVVAIIIVSMLIKIQMTPVAQAKENPQDEIFVQLDDGQVLPYHQVKIVPVINQKEETAEENLDHSSFSVLVSFPYRQKIQQQIREIEPELGDTLIQLANCESTLNPLAVGDDGNSYGLYQIFLRWHPDVTQEQAKDIEFATKWTANKIRQGKGDLWTCWSKI